MATAVEELKAAQGTHSIHSPMGKWRLLVSQLIDALNPSGAGSPDYGWAKRITSDQTGVGVNQTIAFNTADVRGIQFLNNAFILTPGKRYRLTAFVRFKTYSNGTGGFMTLKFTDDNNNALQDVTLDSPSATITPTTSTTAESSSGGLDMVCSIPLNATNQQRTAKLRIVGANGTADVVANEAVMVVTEIPGGI